MYYILLILFIHSFTSTLNGMLSNLRQLRTTAALAKVQPQRQQRWLTNTFKLPDFAALKGSIYNHWYGTKQPTVIKPITAILPPESLTPVMTYEPAVTQSNTPDIESIQNVLNEDHPDFSLAFNLLSDIPTNMNSLEIDALKQQFFDKIDLADSKVISWLPTHSPQELYTLLPNDPKILADTIEMFHNTLESKNHIDWIQEYEHELYNLFDIKSVADLTPIVLDLIQSYYGRSFLSGWLYSSGEYKNTPKYQKLVDIGKQNKKDFSDTTNKFIYLERLLEPSDFIDIAFNIDNSYKDTPSYRHLIQNFHHLTPPEDIDNHLSDKNISDVFHNTIDREKKLIANGYVVMYHAHRWQYGFLSQIYSMLYEHASGKQLTDFIFTHLDDPVLGRVSEQFYASESAKRERLIREGNRYNSKTDPMGISNRASLLFLNKFLFGNIFNPSSCSMYYFLQNDNVGDIDFSLKEIFSMFGHPHAYQVFESELNNLQTEYNNLSQYGELLQIAIPENIVNECVYYTSSGGPKETYITHDGQETTDTRTIIKDLDEHPKDWVEFGLINTRDTRGGLSPESGIKVFSYNAVDHDKWTAFEAKMHNFKTRLTQWLKNHAAQPLLYTRE